MRNTPSPESGESSPDEVKKEKRIFGKTKRTKSVRSAVSSFDLRASFGMSERDVPEVPQVPAEMRPRLESDSRDKQRARQEALSQLTAHSRQDSEVSFSGMSSFSEVRRGFEFNDSRPVFYPPSNNASQASSQSHRFGHGQQESVFSIASVSSYGAVVKTGSLDPFGYALPTRPMSEEMSISVDDTFSFLRRDPVRKRVDSDASSFYFNSSRDVSKRHRRQNDSMASALSGPPISIYNRSYGAHRKRDSSTSASSIAHAYGAFGANGGRLAWAKHQRDFSVDSVASGYSARLGRPGVGDKMFESAREYGVPLTSISASPSQSVDMQEMGNRTSFDSILDTDRRSSMDDSLFDETGRRTSVSSASVFGYESHHPLPRAPGLLPPHQFRPILIISVNSSHGSRAEDDTMITVRCYCPVGVLITDIHSRCSEADMFVAVPLDLHLTLRLVTACGVRVGMPL